MILVAPLLFFSFVFIPVHAQDPPEINLNLDSINSFDPAAEPCSVDSLGNCTNFGEVSDPVNTIQIDGSSGGLIDYESQTQEVIESVNEDMQETMVCLDDKGCGDTGGIVPCSGLDCNSCSVITLIERIIEWLIGVLLVVFAGVTAYAGFKLVISAGNPQAKTEAKQMLTNAFIGIVIVLSAWLLIDTLMRAILPDNGQLDGGTWSSVQCNSQVEPVAGPESGGGTTVGNPALVIPDGCTNEGPSGTSNATVIVCQGDVLGSLPPAPVGNCSEPSRDSTGGNNTTRLVYTYVCQIGP